MGLISRAWTNLAPPGAILGSIASLEPGPATVYPDQQTSSGRVSMPQTCQQPTHVPQQMAPLFDHFVGSAEKVWG
jgi:hypothetical protein